MATKLSYALTTEPFPLQVSSATGTPHIAKLTIVASNPDSSHSVALKAITIVIPVGPAASQLVSTAPSNPVTPMGWKLDDTKQGEGKIEYVFTPEEGHDQVADEGLTFTFDAIRINSQAGTAKVIVKEISTDSATLPFSVTKFPAGWGHVSFWADKTIVKAGDSLALNWSGPTDATYSIDYYTPQTGIVHVPAQGDPPFLNEGLYPLNGGVERNTTFYLNVKAVIDNHEYTARQSVTVTVASVKITASGPDDPVNALDEVVIQWTTTSAKTVTIEPDKQTVDAASGKGEFPVKPASNTTYTLIAEDPRGIKKRVTFAVYVKPPRIISFKATPGVVKAGSPVTLSWETVSSAVTSIQPDIGDVAAKGSKQVTPPTGLTTYKLTAESQFPPATDTVNIIATKPGFNIAVSNPEYARVEAALVVRKKLFLLDTSNAKAWSSADGLHWNAVEIKQPWPKRQYGRAVVFDAGSGPRMWLMGGDEPDGKRSLNDVWRSTDETGTCWEQVKPVKDKVWTPRDRFGCVVFKKKIWVFGGGDASGGYWNDIWSSADGANWTQEIDHAAWSPRCSFSAATFILSSPHTNQIWICGGDTGNKYAPTNEVYYTNDGVRWATWRQNIWYGLSSPLLQQVGNQLWVIGGTCHADVTETESLEPCPYIFFINEPRHGAWEVQGSVPWLKKSCPVASAVFNDALWCVGSPNNPKAVPNHDIWYFLPE